MTDWKMPLWMVSTFLKIGKKMMKVKNNNKISRICEQWVRMWVVPLQQKNKKQRSLTNLDN